MSAALALVPRKAVEKVGVAMRSGKRRWEFGMDMDGNHHFWSTDGVQCGWCRQQRTAAQVQEWERRGRLTERCGG